MDKKQEIYEKTKVKTEHIKVAANASDFEGRIHTHIVDPNGEVYWYIRFNTKLDPETVSKYTMNITQTDGYIINAIITYDKTRNLIVLCPMDLYRQNEYYFLNISKKVRSEKGVNLKRSVHILFKLLDDEISEFSILKNTSEVPKPKQKPKKIKLEERAHYMIKKAYEQGLDSDKLPQAPLELNVIPAFFGLILMILSLIIGNIIFIAFAIAAALIGVLHFFGQLRDDKIKFQINYFFGNLNFDKKRYKKSREYFQKAHILDKNNAMANFALKKCDHAISKGV